MRNISLKSFFLLMSISLTAALVLNMAIAYRAGSLATSQFYTVKERDIPALVRLHELWAHGLQTEQATRNIILNPADQKAWENYAAADADFRASLEALRQVDPQFGPLANSLGALWDKAHRLRAMAQERGREGKVAEATQLINKEETPLWREVKAGVKDAIATESARIAQGILVKGAAVDASRQLSLTAAGVVLVLANALLLLIWRRVGRPTREVGAYVQAVSQGEYGRRLDVKDYAAEFADMAGRVAHMTETLKEKLGLAQGVLQGIATPFAIIGVDGTLQSLTPATLQAFGRSGAVADYLGKPISEFAYRDRTRESRVMEVMRTGIPSSRQFEVPADDGGTRVLVSNLSPIKDLGGAMLGVAASYLDITEATQRERVITAQNELLANAANSSDTVSETVLSQVQDLSACIEQAHTGAAQQAGLVGEAATAMEQMNATVLEVAGNASRAAETAEQAKQQAQNGAEVVLRVVDGIAQVQQQSLRLKTAMSELEQQTKGIGQIMNMISDIADQTNLLALNAAIEAARAGEAGRGFAVVADEVRKLAEKTMHATHEVEEVIRGIREGAQQNIKSVDTTVGAIDTVTVLSQSAGTALGDIVSLIGDASSQIQAIATAAEEQSTASEQITSSIEVVHQICTETSGAMQKSSCSVTSLSDQANHLKKLIGDMRQTA
ncbi:MAG: methyl-accepting chemotaxis protein [Solidesulfovibrio sp. DCME]|uniref:methyl-accepting chemotaxis protein n=1 Tax=Solidesulfovibrio sp. DCME TaxID=3447380 RepID=UPI003D109395